MSHRLEYAAVRSHRPMVAHVLVYSGIGVGFLGVFANSFMAVLWYTGSAYAELARNTPVKVVVPEGRLLLVACAGAACSVWGIVLAVWLLRISIRASVSASAAARPYARWATCRIACAVIQACLIGWNYHNQGVQAAANGAWSYDLGGHAVAGSQLESSEDMWVLATAVGWAVFGASYPLAVLWLVRIVRRYSAEDGRPFGGQVQRLARACHSVRPI